MAGMTPNAEGQETGFVPPFVKKYFTQEVMDKYPPLAESIKKVKDTNGEDDQVWEEFKVHYNKYRNFECFDDTNGGKYDIVFYGVSGYTGYLMMEYLKRVSFKKINQEPFTFAMAGRTARKVREMREREFGGTEWADTPILSASFDDVFSIINLVKSAHVIVNVAGPYMSTQGEVLVDACIQMGVHYVDISGEIPWTLRVLDLHEYAREKGVFVIPSAASAGGFPDLGVYLCAKKLREDYGEETRYAACYQAGGGAEATASGGTLKTRAAMSEAGDDVRKKMGDPFALGGFIPDVDRWGIKNVNVEFGTGKVTAKPRQEDLDVNFAKITEDKKLGVWRGPFVYSFLDTRIVRRSNMLFADLGDQPYGRNFNFMEYALLTPEMVTAMQGGASKKAVSVEEEKAALEASGKYYKEGEGPPLEELEAAWVGYFLYAETETGNSVKLSMIGRDGYFETARVAVETAMCLRFDREKLAFKGGVLNTTVATGTFLAKRLIDSGIKFKMGEW
eukprot:CAMPEP_0117493826 /NCGR_PEP_ID=MMETSP0784-20121206/19295_1 /TAXON_ID=39447 /ORGANISM="" /LENGTH=504 /DNA_ID=CAMNT_0005288685 /DNA_START=71 /DNA_END=1582 /DNA_ORIENTATION=-